MEVLRYPPYCEGKWADAAFVENRRDVKTEFDAWLAEHGGLLGDMLRMGTSMKCTWRDSSTSHATHWYLFQEAVKAHLEECWKLLVEEKLPNL